MSKHKHNYSQHYNNVNNNKPKVVEEGLKPIAADVVVEPTKPKLVQETIETVKLPETVIGMVAGCAKLNVRAEANLFSDIVCVLDNMSEIAINVEKSDKDWFYICTASGIEGYCMRKFVEARL